MTSPKKRKGRTARGRWAQALDACLTLDAFVMEVKNYNDPWFPRRADRTLDEDALRLPFAAYHDAIGHALDAGDIFSAVGIQADIQGVSQPLGFYAWADRILSPIVFPSQSRRAADYMKRVAVSKKRGSTEFQRVLHDWRSQNPQGVLLLAPYIVNRCASIDDLGKDVQAARQYHFEGRDVGPFMYTEPAVMPARVRLPISDETYFNSAWLFGFPKSVDVMEAMHHARLIAIQYQMSWGYPSMVDQQRATQREASIEHERATDAIANATEIRDAALGITRGVGQLRRMVSSAETLLRVIDPLRFNTAAFKRAQESVNNQVFPAGDLHHLTYHLKQSEEFRLDRLRAVDQILAAAIRDFEKRGDDSVPFLSELRSTIAQLRDTGKTDLGLAHARALASGTVLLEVDGPDRGLVAVGVRPDMTHDELPYIEDSVVCLHRLRASLVTGFTWDKVVVDGDGDCFIVFTVDSNFYDHDDMKRKLSAHWSYQKDSDSGDVSKVFASLLRGLFNTEDVTTLASETDKNLTYDSSQLRLRVDVFALAGRK